MKIEADLHLHTIASGHAYSTIDEVARAASSRGLKLIAITDHGPAMPGGPHDYYFGNIKVIPKELYGVRVLMGVEANIRTDGGLDLEEDRLKRLDFVAAGIHQDAAYENKTEAEHTTATIRAIKNPYVRMITHPANTYYALDLERVVRTAIEHNVILEINNSSFTGRRGKKEISIKLARLAKQYQVPLSLNSDAHFYSDVGNIENLEEIIREAGLKEEDIINTSAEKVLDFLKR